MAYNKLKSLETRYEIKVQFKNIKHPIIFETNEIEQNKITEILCNNRQIGCISFYTCEHTAILINTRKIMSIHMLFEDYIEENNEEKEYEKYLKIVFDDIEKPFTCYVEDSIQVADMWGDVSNDGIFESKGFRTSYIDDEDGERFIFNRDDVSYYECSIETLEDGKKQIEDILEKEEKELDRKKM
ncbi:MAG: hypothetical protein ACYDEX_26450 [Mobilitalea sp.]